MLKHLLVVTHPIFSNSKIMKTISKLNRGPKPGDNMLKYTGRIGCSELTDLVLNVSQINMPQGFGSLRYTLY